MSVLTRLVATSIDVGAMLAMVPVFAALGSMITAVRARVMPAGLLQPWHDLIRLHRKRRLRPNFASPYYAVWPVIALVVSAAATVIVPGFAFGLITAPLATVPVVVGLFALAGMARLAALLESGDGTRGRAASRAAGRLLVGMSGWLVALGAAAVQAGSGSLTRIGGTLSVQPGNAALVALTAISLILTLPGWALPDPADYAGPERGLFQVEAMLRLVAMAAVILDLVAPSPMADARAVATWPKGLAIWGIDMIALGGVIMLVSARRFTLWIGVACAVAAVLLVIGQNLPMATMFDCFGGAVGLIGLAWLSRRGELLGAATLVQVGIALIGLGAGATSGAFLILAAAVLARLAFTLAPDIGFVVAGSVLVLAGLPPFGAFAGDFAVVRGVFGVDPVLAGCIVLILTIVAGILLVRLPRGLVAAKRQPRAVLGAVCLGFAIVLGVMPWLI